MAQPKQIPIFSSMKSTKENVLNTLMKFQKTLDDLGSKLSNEEKLKRVNNLIAVDSKKDLTTVQASL